MFAAAPPIAKSFLAVVASEQIRVCVKYFLLLVGGAILLWIDNPRSLCIWSLLIAGAISLLIMWLFISHTALNTFLHRWESEEKFIKKQLDKHRYTLHAIRRRHRQLNTMTHESP